MYVGTIIIRIYSRTVLDRKQMRTLHIITLLNVLNCTRTQTINY